MRASILVFTLVLAAVAADDSQARVPGVANFNQYRAVTSLARSANLVVYTHTCAGTILNNRSVLTAARCVSSDVYTPNRWRFRCGSNQWAYGGTVYPVVGILVNDFDEWSMMNDVAIVRSARNIYFGNYVQPGAFAGANYILYDNQPLNIVGWGYLDFPFWSPSEFNELRQLNQWSINLAACRQPYQAQGFYVQNSMICSGFPNPNNVPPNAVIRDRCFGEPGGPVMHNGVVVGIRSYGLSCHNNPSVPSVSTRISSFINWISNNA